MDYKCIIKPLAREIHKTKGLSMNKSVKMAVKYYRFMKHAITRQLARERIFQEIMSHLFDVNSTEAETDILTMLAESAGVPKEMILGPERTPEKGRENINRIAESLHDPLLDDIPGYQYHGIIKPNGTPKYKADKSRRGPICDYAFLGKPTDVDAFYPINHNRRMKYEI